MSGRLTALVVAGAMLSVPATASAQPATFDPGRLSHHIKILSSDAFEGRGPATRAEPKTIDYIVSQFQAVGLQPGGDLVDGKRSWTQAVPLLKSDIVGTPQLTLDLGNGQRQNLTQREQIAVRSPLNGTKKIDFDNLPLLFVGYGVTAPERNWDDFKGMDVRGKLLVVLLQDPDFEGGEGDFDGKAMTYYGRWTYKCEEAARRGAAGILLIHETEAAAYGWNTVRNSYTNTLFDIVRANPVATHTPFEAWIQRDLAAQIFQASGLTFDQAKAMAKTRAFQPVQLKAALSAHFGVDANVITSHNVAGILPGKTHRDEYLIYSAHWDHLGIGQPDANGDNIYNGAVDNASGISMMIEQARAFAHEPRTDRSTMFLALTTEEKGLLGSEYYALHPLYPLSKTVALINTNSMAWGRAHDFSISGTAKLDLIDDLIEEGRRFGLHFTTDLHPEVGSFFRSDHFSLAKVGVPAVSFEPGLDLLNGGRARGEALNNDYFEKRYHQPDDEWSPDWDLSGMVEDETLLHALGKRLANSREWPNWSRDSEFRAVRDRTAVERK